MWPSQDSHHHASGIEEAEKRWRRQLETACRPELNLPRASTRMKQSPVAPVAPEAMDDAVSTIHLVDNKP